MQYITECWYVKRFDTKMAPFEYKAKFEKKLPLFKSKIGIFGKYFKRLYEESFEDLQ